METSQQQQHPLSIESFSYSWLAANIKPSLETLLDAAADESAAASSYIEMDPRMPPSKRFFRSYSSHEFNFDFPADHSPPMNHADELFADGYLVPFFLRKAASHRNHHRDDDDDDDSASNSVASSPDSTGSTIEDGPVRPGAKKTRRCSSFRRVVEKYLELIGPLLGKLSGRRGGPRNRRSLSSRSEGMVMDSSSNKNKKKLMMKRWLSSSGESSPRRVSAAYSEDGWRRSASSSCDSESSIREAVLHCKKSFGK